jgi:hypothetical protein
MKFLGFDIEISDLFDMKPGEDLRKYAPFHISVAATVDSEGKETLWYSVDEHGTPAVDMTRAKAQELLAHLQAIQQAGYMLCAWNGLNFDLRWIGHNAGDLERAARVALSLYDPMFQFFNQRGFPVGLEAVGRAMGVKQGKLMDAAQAPREWRAGNYQRVMDYVLTDVRILNQLVTAIAREGAIRWVTQRGTTDREPIARLKTVAEVLRDPEPDQSWMRGGGLKRRLFIDWLPKHILNESP